MPISILGIDIAKQKFDVALLCQNKSKHKIFNNNLSGFSQLLTWLQKQGVTQLHACLEATGSYGDALAHHLVDAGFTVSIVNPSQIKSFAGSQLIRNKTDKVDAALIANFCLKFQPPAWQPAPVHIRELQAMVRRLDALLALHTQETNRLDTAHTAVTESIQALLGILETQIKTLKKRIRDHIDQHPDLRHNRDLLDTIPGIGEATISQILAFIGEVSRFKTAKQLAAFIGLNPKQHFSGTSVRGRAHLSKMGNSALRKAFYMPALVAMTHNPTIHTFSQRLKQQGKNGKVIVCAAMRKLIHIIYGVLKSKQPFDTNLVTING